MADALAKQGVKRICELVTLLWYLILPSLFESLCDLHGNLVSLTFVAGAGIWLRQNSVPQTLIRKGVNFISELNCKNVKGYQFNIDIVWAT